MLDALRKIKGRYPKFNLQPFLQTGSAFLITFLCPINGEMCLNLTFRSSFFILQHSSWELHQQCASCVCYAFIWMLKGKCLLFLQPNCLPEMNKSCLPSVIEFDHWTLLYLVFFIQCLSIDLHLIHSLSSTWCEQ